MNINKFNKLFSKTCDDIYAIVGEKQQYDKADAKIMLDGAIEIISRNFKIHEHRLVACQNRVNRIGSVYAEKFSKTMGFEGAILSLTLGILEGTGEIKLDSGAKLLTQALDVGGLKLSRTIK